MNIKEQITEAKNKNLLLAEITFNLRFLQENNPRVLNIPQETTAEFKELCLAVLEFIDETNEKLIEFKKFIPTFTNQNDGLIKDLAV